MFQSKEYWLSIHLEEHQESYLIQEMVYHILYLFMRVTPFHMLFKEFI